MFDHARPSTCYVVTKVVIHDVIDVVGVLYALSSCPSLTELELEGNGFGLYTTTTATVDSSDDVSITSHEITILPPCPHLLRLKLSNNNLRQMIIFPRWLSSHPCLTELNLSSNKLRDISYISTTTASSSRLIKLDLSGNEITNFHDASIFSSFPALKDLNLSCCHLRPDILKTLSLSPLITRLDLGGNNIDATGAADLAKHICSFTQLQELFLPCSNMGDDGIEALATSLSHCPFLEVLDLAENNFGASGLTALAAALTAIPHSLLQRLNLCRNDFSGYNFGISNQHDLAFFLSSRCPQLTDLNLSCNNLCFKGEVVQSLFASPLSKLNLSSNRINIVAFSTMLRTHGENLRELCLSGNYDSYIFRFNFNRNFIDEMKLGEGVKVLAASLSSCRLLEVLDLSSNKINGGGVEAIVASQIVHQLKKLDLCRNEIGAEGAKALSRCFSLQNQLQMTELNLSENNIGDGIIELSSSLSSCPQLTRLYLANNRMNNKNAKPFFNSLHLCPMLKELDVSGNLIGNDAIVTLVDNLSTRVTHLNLGSNDIGDQGAKTIFNALPSFRNLTVLDLSDNRIGNDGIIKKEFGGNYSLRKLNLSKNKFGNSGARALFKLVESFTQLTELDISRNNSINDGSTKELFSSLPRLTKLELYQGH